MANNWGVLQRHPCLDVKRFHEFFVIAVEAGFPAFWRFWISGGIVGRKFTVALFVNQLRDGDQLAVGVEHGHTEHTASPVARLFICLFGGGGVEVIIQIARDQQRLFRFHHLSGKACLHRNPNFLELAVDQKLCPELLPIAIEQPQRTAIGLH